MQLSKFENFQKPCIFPSFASFSIYPSNFDLYLFREQHVSHTAKELFSRFLSRGRCMHAVACTHTRVQVQGYESIGGETRRKSCT